MARQNLRNLLLIATLFIVAFVSESPRQHVEARTLLKREVEETTIDSVEDLTTKAFTTEASLTTTGVHQIPTIVPTTSETITEVTTDKEEVKSASESTESYR